MIYHESSERIITIYTKQNGNTVYRRGKDGKKGGINHRAIDIFFFFFYIVPKVNNICVCVCVCVLYIDFSFRLNI